MICYISCYHLQSMKYVETGQHTRTDFYLVVWGGFLLSTFYLYPLSESHCSRSYWTRHCCYSDRTNPDTWNCYSYLTHCTFLWCNVCCLFCAPVAHHCSAIQLCCHYIKIFLFYSNETLLKICKREPRRTCVVDKAALLSR